MKTLAKAGFAQSYTYFTWRNFKREIEEYFTELTQSEAAEYMRGNLFPNTHDILPVILQEGRPASLPDAAGADDHPLLRLRHLLRLRAVREHAGAGQGGVPLLEKYEYKVWDWDRPGNIIEDVTRLNRIGGSTPPSTSTPTCASSRRTTTTCSATANGRRPERHRGGGRQPRPLLSP
jgi:starch synthase (maltosyl-transferring)